MLSYLPPGEGFLGVKRFRYGLAEREDVPIVDNVSFDRSALLIIRHVTEALRKRGDYDLADLL